MVKMSMTMDEQTPESTYAIKLEDSATDSEADVPVSTK